VDFSVGSGQIYPSFRNGHWCGEVKGDFSSGRLF